LAVPVSSIRIQISIFYREIDMSDITGNTVSAVKLDILGNAIIPIPPKSNFARVLTAEPIPFDADQVAAMMGQARDRIDKRAKPYPGVWSWAKQNRPEMIAKTTEYKLEFVKVTQLEDLPACHKWLFAFEQSAKKIIEVYSRLHQNQNQSAQ
jgi:hypothetical protein